MADIDDEDQHVDDAVSDPAHPGPAAAPLVAEHRRARISGKLKVAGGAVAVGVIGWVAWSYTYQPEAAKPKFVVGKSEEVYKAREAPKPLDPLVRSRLVVEPPIANFGQLVAGTDRQLLSLRLTAVDGPVDIANVIMPYSDRVGLDMRADSCVGHKLVKGESCVVTINFAPIGATTLANQILISGVTYETGGASGGQTQPLSTTVEVTGASTTPPPPPPKPVAVDYGAMRTGQMQSAYLAARERPTLADQSRNSFSVPRAPRDADWSGLGFAKVESSFPVDMTRVVTVDKAIPAVIKVPIDSRNPSRAVATVERDIYGGDGRMVVIERGSTLVGRVGAIADSSEEKVAIQWVRLVRPDGVAFSFEGSSGDAMGRSGVLAHIDNRWLERFGTTALASVVTAGITLGLNGTQTSTTQNGTNVSGTSGYITTGGTTTNALTGRAAAAQQIRQDLLPLYDQFKNEQLAIPVIRTVPAGTRITIWPSTDLWLKPVKDEAPVAIAQSGGGSAQKGNPYAALSSLQGSGGAQVAPSNGMGYAANAAAADVPSGAAPATNANQGYEGGDMSLKGESAAATARERLTATGSTAGSPTAMGRPGGYPVAYGTASPQATGYSSAPTMGSPTVVGVAAPPWSAR